MIGVLREENNFCWIWSGWSFELCWNRWLRQDCFLLRNFFICLIIAFFKLLLWWILLYTSCVLGLMTSFWWKKSILLLIKRKDNDVHQGKLQQQKAYKTNIPRMRLYVWRHAKETSTEVKSILVKSKAQTGVTKKQLNQDTLLRSNLKNKK